jgi:hypothetical protein
MIRTLGVIGLVAGLALSSASAQERKIQFAPTAGVFFGDEDIGSVIGGLGVRADFNLSKTIMISPELLFLFLGYFGPTLPSFTVSYKFGKAFAGLGVAAVDYPLMVKFQGGTKTRHWMLAGSFLTGGGMMMGGLTASYLF